MGKIKSKNIFFFSLLALCLGAVSGLLIWAVLKVMSLGIDFIWTVLPEHIGSGIAAGSTENIVYTFAVCLCGGLIIGLFQKKFGLLPDTLETVMAQLKRDGTYPYDKLHILIIAALLPLIFGGSLGPEAGLTGLIVGLCCWVGDRLKYKNAQVRELAQAGMAASLGVIFNAPFFGIANNIENKEDDGQVVFDKEEIKKAKIVVYTAGIIGGFGAIGLLSHFFGGAMGISRFEETVRPGFDDWKWFLVFAAGGIVCGILYKLLDLLAELLAKPLKNHRVISCMVGGAALALMGSLLPLTMFSGEHEMGELMESWQSFTAITLILIALGKILLINVCVNFGWRGGNIFPVIFAGTCMGYAMVILTGVEPIFGVAVSVAAICGYIMRKPLTVVAVLILCFPVTIVIPLAFAALVGSLVPEIGKKDKKEDTKQNTEQNNE